MAIKTSLVSANTFAAPEGGLALLTLWNFDSSPDWIGSVLHIDWGDGTTEQSNNDVPGLTALAVEKIFGPGAPIIGVAQHLYRFGPAYEFEAIDTFGVRLGYNADAGILLSGSGIDDVIVGGLFDDTLNGGNGDDVIWGLDDGDLVNGGGGNDEVRGGDGADTLLGQSGDDVLSGDDDDDSLLGGSGADQLLGGDGDDVLSGQNGDDFLEGGAGQDTASGGNDNDIVLGGGDDDRLYGNSGDDELFGEDGSDFLAGGEGADTLVGGDNSLELNDGDDTAVGGNGNDLIFGGRGDDLLRGDAGNDTLVGEDGNDLLIGGAGADILYGGIGADRMVTTDDGEMDVFQFFSLEEGGDRIIGFVRGQDRIQLGFTEAVAVISGPAPGAPDPGPAILFDTLTARLFYDANGSDPGGTTLIATLPGVTGLGAEDFFFA